MSSAEEGDAKRMELLEERVKKLEERLNNLLTGKVEVEVRELSVAPRSKMRMVCE